MNSQLRFFLSFFLLIFSFKVGLASHIVGGGFTYKYISANRYVIRLEYYKDCSPSSADYPPGNLRIGIYGKSSNTLVQSFDLIPGPVQSVDFLAGNCVVSAVSCIQKRVYEDTLRIDPSLFLDSLGYYMSYEQCCRNFGIKNVLKPDDSGIAFYADFPALKKNGTNFINSSPTLKTEQNLYLCAGEEFRADYSHFDIDGDSLVYRLVNPYKGSTNNVINNANGISILNPGPYQVIDWSMGYGLQNIMDGNPDITIDSATGLVYVLPQQSGIYSFAISIEEYRNGVLIGEIRREIQYQIILCPVRFNPKITWLNPDEKILKANSKYCFQFTCDDLNLDDSLTATILDITETLNEQNFTFSIDTIVRNPISIEVCFKTNCEVPNSTSEGFKIALTDHSCPRPKTDTLEVLLEIVSLDFEDPFKKIPNVFSPNKDGINDYFNINNNYPASCIDDFSIVIYNRWGENVFESKDFGFQWSGEGLPVGVYFYVIKLKGREKAGNILLMY